VQPSSPAEQGGVRNDDIIIGFNDRDIDSSSQLPFYVGQVRPGSTARLTIMRDGAVIQLNVVVGSLPGSGIASANPPIESPRANTLGLTVSALSQEAQELSGIGGVRVDELDVGPAANAGLLSGDVIVELNRLAVPTVEAFGRAVDALPAEGFVPIRIWREGRGTTLVLELE
jgi:serine protease Do